MVTGMRLPLEVWNFPLSSKVDDKEYRRAAFLRQVRWSFRNVLDSLLMDGGGDSTVAK